MKTEQISVGDIRNEGLGFVLASLGLIRLDLRRFHVINFTFWFCKEVLFLCGFFFVAL